MFVNLLEANLAAEQVKLALEVICLEEWKVAVGAGDGALREGRASPHPPSMGLRTGFDPSRRRENTAPPQEGASRRPYGAPQRERKLPFEDSPSTGLRTGPSGFLRLNGRVDGTFFPQGERPTTHAGHPEEARGCRAVSKDLS